MGISVWAYFFFTVLLGAVFAGIIAYNYMPSRKRAVEEPKYRMLQDD
jgi:cbb3-type cytochrome oxidase subunit 3